MFNFYSKEQRKNEELLYALVVEEIERNEIHKALWAKAVSDSDNDKQRTQALYIKYRVQKLKDEISDQIEEQNEQERIEKKQQAKAKKDTVTLSVLNTTVVKVVSTLQWLILVMVLLSLGVLFFTYLFYDSGDYYMFGTLLLIGLSCFGFSLYLYYLSRKIISLTDYREIKKRLNILFSILIPFSLVGTILGAVFPVMGIFMFIAFIGLLVHAFRFYRAFNYAKKNYL